MTIPTEEDIREAVYERTEREVRDFLDRYSLDPAMVNDLAQTIAEEVMENYEMPQRGEDE